MPDLLWASRSWKNNITTSYSTSNIQVRENSIDIWTSFVFGPSWSGKATLMPALCFVLWASRSEKTALISVLYFEQPGLGKTWLMSALFHNRIIGHPTLGIGSCTSGAQVLGKNINAIFALCPYRSWLGRTALKPAL